MFFTLSTSPGKHLVFLKIKLILAIEHNPVFFQKHWKCSGSNEAVQRKADPEVQKVVSFHFLLGQQTAVLSDYVRTEERAAQ